MKRETINTRAIVRSLIDHVKPYKWVFLMVTLLIIVRRGVDIIVPLYFKEFFDVLAEDALTGDELHKTLVGILLMVLFWHALGWVAKRFAAFMNTWFQSNVMADAARTGHEYILKHSYRFFGNSFTGSLVRRVNKLSRSFETLLDEFLYKFLGITVIGIGYLAVLWSRSWQLGFALMIWLIVYAVVTISYATWKTKYDYKASLMDSESTGVLADAITNSTSVKLFTGLGFEVERFKEVTNRWRKSTLLTWNLGEAMDAMQSFLMMFSEFIVLYIAVGLYRDGVLTIGDFALIQSYLIGFFMVMWDMGRVVRRVYGALADADEMVEILNTPHEVQDARNAKALTVTDAEITFEDVFFSYSKTRRILKGLNLTIHPGEKVALVGPSGAGKSTITKLLLRFFDVETGKILIDGQRIDKVTQDSLRANLSLVPQEPILFHRTIMDNIRYGRRDATDEEVIEAAKQAHAHEFINDLPEGYNTFVGERGVKLSGGERQRVAIARAILKNAPILILDEATSSLDSESEALIQEALETLMEGKTTIVIAHRLSTIMKMDRILVIEEGQLSMSGSHSELLNKKDNIYKKLWNIQAGGFTQD